MTATATVFSPASTAAPISQRTRAMSPTHLVGLLLILPASGFLLAFFVVLALTLFAYSVLTNVPTAW